MLMCSYIFLIYIYAHTEINVKRWQNNSEHTITCSVASCCENGPVTVFSIATKSGTSGHNTPFLMSSIADRLSQRDRTFLTAITYSKH